MRWQFVVHKPARPKVCSRFGSSPFSLHPPILSVQSLLVSLSLTSCLFFFLWNIYLLVAGRHLSLLCLPEHTKSYQTKQITLKMKFFAVLALVAVAAAAPASMPKPTSVDYTIDLSMN